MRAGVPSRSFFIFLSAVLLWTALKTPALAGSSATPSLRVEGVRHGASGEKTRIVVDLDRQTEFRAFLLASPPRAVLDIPAAKWTTPQARFLSDQIVKGYRSGDLPREGLTRLVFDLKKPAVISSAFVLPKSGNNRDRIVIDLQPASANLFAARTSEVHGNRTLKGNTATAGASTAASTFRAAESAAMERMSPPAQPSSSAAMHHALPTRKPARTRLYTVAIDAGHGGEDPGAIGNGGVKEKHVTLSAAKELKRQLEETGRYRVVLTRSGDKYIRLRERLAISRREGADLFISLHADKIDRKNVRGASIYTLSETASDDETARLADQENNAGVVAGVDLSEESADVADILLDLAMREKMNESNLFARYLRDALSSKKIRLLPNSHRSAGFAVLKAPDVPAVLIEIGFLSNPDEAKLLNSGEFHQRIAQAIIQGIDAYFRKIQALQKI